MPPSMDNKGSLGTCFIPHLRLANSPQDDPQARGAFIGLSTDVGRGALFRALLEGLAFEFRSSLEALVAHSVVTLQEVCAIGGGTRNELLMRIKATVLNHTIVVADVDEAAALGAAMLGGIGAGIYSDAADALDRIQISETPIDPTTDQVYLYEALFHQVFRHIYPALRPINHSIHRLQSTGMLDGP